MVATRGKSLVREGTRRGVSVEAFQSNQEAAMIDRIRPGPFVMLNLYRLREVAGYSMHPDRAPSTPVSGRTLFDR